MKLNHDCVRDLLLTLEENLLVDDDGKSHFLFLDNIICFDRMKLYAKADIIYCSQKLDEAELISITIQYGSGEVYLLAYNYITFKGHQYLDSIRDKKVWDTVREKLQVTSGSASFKVITTIAEKAALQLLGL